VPHISHADPEQFDVVFCANATAGIKPVLEAFTAQNSGLRYQDYVDGGASLSGDVRVSERARPLLFRRRGRNLVEVTAMCGGSTRTVSIAGIAQLLQAAGTGGSG